MEHTAPVSLSLSRRARLLAAATLALVAVAIAAIVMIVVSVVSSPKSDAAALAADRAAVQSVASQCVTRMWSFEASTIGSYRAGVEALITPNFAPSFETYAARVEPAVKSAGAKETVVVYATAVAAISDTKATVLVVGARTPLLPKSAGSKQYQKYAEERFRQVLSLVKIDGQWKVDNMASAEGLPSGAPSPQASATGGTK